MSLEQSGNKENEQEPPTGVLLTLHQRLTLLPERVRKLLKPYLEGNVSDQDLHNALAKLRSENMRRYGKCKEKNLGYSFAQEETARFLLNYISRCPLRKEDYFSSKRNNEQLVFNGGISEYITDFLCNCLNSNSLTEQQVYSFILVWLGHLFQMNSTIHKECDLTYSECLLEHYRLCIGLILDNVHFCEVPSDTMSVFVSDHILLELARLNCGIDIRRLQGEAQEVIKDILSHRPEQQSAYDQPKNSSQRWDVCVYNFQNRCSTAAQVLSESVRHVENGDFEKNPFLLEVLQNTRHIEIGSICRNLHDISPPDILHKDALDFGLLQTFLKQTFVEAADGSVHVFLADLEERAEYISLLLHSLDDNCHEIYAIAQYIRKFLGLDLLGEGCKLTTNREYDFHSIASDLGIVDHAGSVQYYLIEKIFQHLSDIGTLVVAKKAVLHECGSRHNYTSLTATLSADNTHVIFMSGIASCSNVLQTSDCGKVTTLACVLASDPLLSSPTTLPAYTSRQFFEGAAGCLQNFFNPEKQWSGDLGTMVYSGYFSIVPTPELNNALKDATTSSYSYPFDCFSCDTQLIFIIPSIPQCAQDDDENNECGSY